MFVLQLLAICKSAPAPNIGPTLHKWKWNFICQNNFVEPNAKQLTLDDSKWRMVF